MITDDSENTSEYDSENISEQDSQNTSERELVLVINEETVSLKDVAPSMTLLQYLHQSRRTGTKEGCGDGDCGACTVAIVDRGSDQKFHYQAVNSCLIPLGTVAGKEIITVEGLADQALHPVQAAMVQTGGSQCGYCTPGFIMSLFAAYYQGKVDDIAIEGNLCRCTGYLPIRQAAQRLTAELASAPASNQGDGDRFFTKLVQMDQSSRGNAAWQYIGAQGHFYRPTQLDQVLALLQQYPEATLVAGATDLGLEMSHHRQSFPVLIALEAVTELQQIAQSSETVEIGAAVPLNRIQAELSGLFAGLDEMLHWFAAAQVRSRATIGGNLATASPIGDLPPVLLALDATIHLASRQGRRTLALADFFQGYRQTDLQPGEVIVSVSIPRHLTPNALLRHQYSYKVGKRGTDDISIVAAAFTIDLDAHNQICHARLAYGGVAATPIRAIAVEQALLGQPWSIATIQQVKPLLREVFTPLTDLRGSAEYRRKLVANLFEKFFIEMQASPPSSDRLES